jgi:hypothetical protein
MANLCEIAAGTLMEASVPRQQRWIPKGMTIEYMARATTDVTATARLPELIYGEPQDVIVPVTVLDQQGTEVVHADITMYVSPRPAD